MTARIEYAKVAPSAVRAVLQVERHARQNGLEPSLLQLVRLRASQELAGRINGEPGLLTYEGDRIIAATAFDLHDGRIRGIYRVLNPDKLKAVHTAA